MKELDVRILYCRYKKPPPVWITLDQLETVAKINGCEVSLEDGGVLFRKHGYRCLQFSTESSQPLLNLEGDRFTANKHKDVVLKIKWEGVMLRRIQITKFIATLLHHVDIPDKWCVYNGYNEDLRKYYK